MRYDAHCPIMVKLQIKKKLGFSLNVRYEKSHS